VEDLSDNEREEQLRQWWAENWLWIVGGVALGLGALGGWQYWQKSRIAAAEADEASYSSVLDSLSRNEFDPAVATADGLRQVHPKSPYADQADLALARAAVDRREFDAAAARLRNVAGNSRDPQLRQVATTRLARVLVEQGKHDEAVALLDPGSAGGFAPVYHELRGDAFVAKGDVAAARREYDAALAATPGDGEPPIDVGYVELKRDALGGEAAPAVASTETQP
jgi:predicted negative regulator of RcsB-dependent stress response